MSYIQLEIEIPADYQEFLIAELNEMEFDGFDQYDDHIIAWIPEKAFNDVHREQLEHYLIGIGKGAHVRSESRLDEQKNWNEAWEATIQPMTVGRFHIRPSWAAQLPEPDPELIPLEIDPKMSFGTGYHETTRIMLRLLPDYIERGSRVMDAGTGTGILSIAALKLGAESAFAFDIDEWSYLNARENALLNETAEAMEIHHGGAEVIPEGSEEKYDVVLANINRNILEDLGEQLCALPREGGRLLLSGLLESDEAIIRRHPAYSRLTFLEKRQEGEWIGLAFQK